METYVSVSNSLKVASLKYCFDVICLEKAHHLAENQENVLLIMKNIKEYENVVRNNTKA